MYSSKFYYPRTTVCWRPLLLSNVHDQLQIMLNRLGVFGHRKSLIVNTNKSEVMCWNSRSDNRLLASSLLWRHTTILHRHIQIPGHGVWQKYQSDHCGWCSTETLHGWHFQWKIFLFKRMSLPTGCMLAFGSSKLMQFLLACTQARSGQLLS